MNKLLVIVIFLFLGGTPLVYAQRASEQFDDEGLGALVTDPLAAIYDEAMEFYKQRRYVEAREKFQELQAISPEAYPSSKVFLKRIDQHITHQEARLSHEQERQEYLRMKKEEQLQASKQEQFKELRRTYRQEKITNVQKKKEEALKKQQATRDLIHRGEDRYRNILALYKAGRFVEAKDQVSLLKQFLVKYEVPQKFRAQMTQKAQKAEAMIGNRERQQKEKIARDEQRNQAQGQKQLAREKKSAEAKQREEEKEKDRRLAEEAKLRQQEKSKQMKEKMALSKKDKFAALLATSPKPTEPKKVPKGQKRIPAVQPKPTVKKVDVPAAPEEVMELSQRQELKAKLTQEVDALYRDGIELYRSRQWSLARDIFSQIDKLWPNYKSTRSYLTAIDQSAGSSQPRAKSREDIIKEALDAQSDE